MRTRALAILLLMTAACGFTPAFAPGGGASALTGAVRADDPDFREAFDFVAALEARFGLPSNPAYALAYQIAVREEEKINSRVHVIGAISYQLRDISTGAQVAAGTVENFVAYSNVTGSTARVVALPRTVADARARLIQSLADQVALELIAAVSTR